MAMAAAVSIIAAYTRQLSYSLHKAYRGVDVVIGCRLERVQALRIKGLVVISCFPLRQPAFDHYDQISKTIFSVPGRKNHLISFGNKKEKP